MVGAAHRGRRPLEEAPVQKADRPAHAAAVVAVRGLPCRRAVTGAGVRTLAPHTHRAPRVAKRQDGMRRLLVAAAVAVLVRAAGGAETWTVTTIAGDGTEGHQDGTSTDTTQFGFLDASVAPSPWLIGVTVMEDDRTVLLIDNYNQAIRKIELRTGETTTLLSTKAPCEPNKCRCRNDLTLDCDDPQRHAKAQQLSGIVGFTSTAFFSNRWNENKLDTSQPTIYKVNIASSPIAAVPIVHSMPTKNITFAPFGLAKGRTNAELVFTNYGASISMINVYSGVITYVAGPALRGSPGEQMGYRDGFGTQVQVASPMGIVTDKRQQYSYFVDSLLCNVRRLDLQTLEVTTLVGPNALTSADFPRVSYCGFADGIGNKVRFTSPNGITALAGDRLVVTDIRDHMVRIIDLQDLSAKTLGGVRGFPGWVNGDQPDIIRFNIPSGITATSNGGTLVVTDQGSNRVRVLQKLCTPFYVVVEGKCLPCDAIACGLGYYRAMCQYDQTDGLCRKCPYELPPNSEWDIKSPNCSWTCAQGYEKTVTKGVGSDTQVCVESGGASKGFQLTEQVLIGIVIAGALLVIALTIALTWWYWNKRKPRVELVDMKSDRIPEPIEIEKPVYEMDTGEESHQRDTTSPLLRGSSVVRPGSALAMYRMGSMVVQQPDESPAKAKKRRDPLAQTMAELGLDDSSLGRFGARSFGTTGEVRDIAV